MIGREEVLIGRYCSGGGGGGGSCFLFSFCVFVCMSVFAWGWRGETVKKINGARPHQHAHKRARQVCVRAGKGGGVHDMWQKRKQCSGARFVRVSRHSKREGDEQRESDRKQRRDVVRIADMSMWLTVVWLLALTYVVARASVNACTYVEGDPHRHDLVRGFGYEPAVMSQPRSDEGLAALHSVLSLSLCSLACISHQARRERGQGTSSVTHTCGPTRVTRARSSRSQEALGLHVEVAGEGG